jgi:carbon-monoxide dehydrogenase medium subunit
MNPFIYHRPKTIAEAEAQFADAEDAAFLSGGHTLLPAMKQRLAMPSHLVDLSGVDGMRGIAVKGSVVSIGAGTTHGEVAASQIVRGRIPALAGLAGSIGDRHVRHRGTIGGSVANNDPAADYPAAVLSLGATILTSKRRIAADDFFDGLYSTVREPKEIVTAVDFPIPEIAAYAKFRSAASRYSIVGVFISKTGSAVRIAVTGAGANGVFRPVELEQALSNDFRPDAIEGCSVDPSELMTDISGTAEYRAALIMIMAKRALRQPGSVQTFK